MHREMDHQVMLVDIQLYWQVDAQIIIDCRCTANGVCEALGHCHLCCFRLLTSNTQIYYGCIDVLIVCAPLAVFAALDVVLMLCLFLWQVFFIGIDETTIEFLYDAQSNHKYNDKPTSRLVSLWHSNIVGGNLRFEHYKRVLGNDWYCWLLPAAPQFSVAEHGRH